VIRVTQRYLPEIMVMVSNKKCLRKGPESRLATILARRNFPHFQAAEEKRKVVAGAKRNTTRREIEWDCNQRLDVNRNAPLTYPNQISYYLFCVKSSMKTTQDLQITSSPRQRTEVERIFCDTIKCSTKI